jgi:hypothetical protein
MNLTGSLAPADLTYIPPRELMVVAYASINFLNGPISVENLPLMETVAPIRISFGDSAYVVFEKRISVPIAKMVMNDKNNARFLQVFIFSSSIKKIGPSRVGMALWPEHNSSISIPDFENFYIMAYVLSRNNRTAISSYKSP